MTCVGIQCMQNLFIKSTLQLHILSTCCGKLEKICPFYSDLSHLFSQIIDLYIALSAKEALPNDSYNCGNSNSSLPCLSHPKKLPLTLFLNSVYWMLWGTEETLLFFFFFFVNYEYHFELYYCTKLYKVIQAKYLQRYEGRLSDIIRNWWNWCSLSKVSN